MAARLTHGTDDEVCVLFLFPGRRIFADPGAIARSLSDKRCEQSRQGRAASLLVAIAAPERHGPLRRVTYGT